MHEFKDISFDELVVKEREGVIADKTKMSDNTYSYLIRLKEHMRFYPGQYITVKFQLDRSITRAYTFTSSSVREDQFELNIEITKDPTTSHIIANKDIGDTIKFKGPFGRFVLPTNVSKLVFIAVDIAINPFISMLNEIKDRKLDIKVFLYYQSRSDRILFKETLDKLVKEINFDYEMTDIMNIDLNSIEADRILICGEKKITNPFLEDVDRTNILLEQWF